jgi:hypothetical protein
VDCAKAKDNSGNITINGKVFTAQIGSRTTLSWPDPWMQGTIARLEQ